MIKTPVQVLIFASDPVVYPDGFKLIHEDPQIRGEGIYEDPRIRWSEDKLKAHEEKVEAFLDRYLTDAPLSDDERLYNGYDTLPTTRQYGVDSLCHQVRLAGYTCQVVHFTQLLKEADAKSIIDKFVDASTLMIGFSQTFAGGFGNARYRHQLVDSIYWPSPRQHLLKEWAKSKNPNIKFVLGGAFLNDTREIQKEDDPLKVKGTPLDDIDIFNHGFGDVTIIEILKDIEADQIKDDYVDKFSRLNIVDNVSRYEDEDLIDSEQQVGLEVGRGCIFKCKFCSFSLLGKEKGSYIKGYECIEKELVHNWQKYGTYQYFITDDTFNDDTEKLERIHEVKKKFNIPLELHSYIRLDLMNRLKQEQLLKDIGLKVAYIGVETLNPESSVVIGKGWHPDEQLAYIKELKSPTGIFGDDVRFHASFIYGLPEDTKLTMRDMHNKLTDLEFNKIDHITIFPLMIVDTKLRDVTVNKSDIAANWQEYGYEAENEELLEMHMKNPMFKTLREDATPDERDKLPTALWKNKHGLRIGEAWKAALTTKKRWAESKYSIQDINKISKDYWSTVIEHRKKYLERLMQITKHTSYTE